MNEPTIEPTLRRDPVAGDLLVASIMLADGVFNQSVVLILDADEDGALGVILNEISQTPLDAVLPDWVSAVSEPRMLFHGGPVSPNGAICLASVAAAGEEPPGWRRLFDTGPQASCSRRSPKACGIWRPPTTAMSSGADLFSCGVRYCVGKRARSRSSRPGWRLPSSTERPVILSNHRPHK
jgi:hypothetical protein